MKRLALILFSFALIFISKEGHAQEFKAGIKAGWTQANLTGELAGILNLNGTYQSGFHAGLWTSYQLSEKFAIQPEVLFNQYGTQQNADGIDSRADIRLSYISVPVLMKAYLAEGFSLQAGPQFSYLIDKDLDVAVSDISANANFVDVYKEFDTGILIGAGYEFDFGLTLGAHFYQGFNNVADIPLVEVRNRAFQVSAGWRLY